MGFEIINKLKKEQNLTNAQLADLSGVTLSTLDKITSGANKNPKLDTLQAICRVLGCTLNDFMDEQTHRCVTHISNEALRLARDYDTALDDRGRRTIRNVMDFEVGYAAQRAEKEKAERKSALQNHQEDTSEEIAIYITTLYHQPVSAGNGESSEYDYSETVQLKKMPPNGTSYIVPVQGDSVEPLFSDGDKVFVRAQIDIEPGQTGVFFMDGQMWIKELGDGVLLSHNPKYPPRPMTDDIRCQGLVLGVCDESYFVR